MRPENVRIFGTIPSSATLRSIFGRLRSEGYFRVVPLEDGVAGLLNQIKLTQDEGQTDPFEELVATVMTQLGHGPVNPIAEPGQVAEAIRSALDDLNGLGPFESGRRWPGIRRRLHRALSELWGSGISASDLVAAGEQHPIFSDKLQALADIERRIESVTVSLDLELPHFRTRKCLSISPGANLSNMRIIAIGGLHPEWTRLKWLKWMADQGAQIVLVLPWREGGEDFHSTRLVADFFKVEIELDAPLPELAEHVFRRDRSGSHIDVLQESAADPLAEVEWTLRRASKQNSAGTPWQKIAIIVRRLEDYAPMISAAAHRLNVPVQMNINEPLMANRFAQWLLGVLNGLLDANPGTLADLARSTYAATPSELQNEFRSVCIDAMSFEANAWGIVDQWAFGKSEIGWLANLLRWRTDALGRARSMGEWHLAFQELCELEPIANLSGSAAPSAERDRLALSEISTLIAHRARFASAGHLTSFGDFVSELSGLLDGHVVPFESSRSGLQVASSPWEIGDIDCLHVLGMLEGIFPRRRSEDPILNDDERRAICEAAGDNSLSTSIEIARAERDLFIWICAVPNTSLALSYPASDDERDNVPAFYLKDVMDAAGPRFKMRHRNRELWAPEPEECIAAADARLSAALKADRISTDRDLATQPSALQRIRASADQAVTPRELSEAATCPFQYGFRRQLNLRPPATARRLARLSQLSQAENLARFKTKEEAVVRLQRAVELEIEANKRDLSAHDIKLLRATARKRIEAWAETEFAAREIWPKDQGSAKLNVPFNGESLDNSLNLDEQMTLKLKGKVDVLASFGAYTVASVYGVRKSLAELKPDRLEDPQLAELGAYFAAIGKRSAGQALEFSTDDGKRTMVLRDRIDGQAVSSARQQNLEVVNLDAKESGLMRQAKEVLKRTVKKMRESNLEATPGDACKYCDYGDICRQSAVYASGSLEVGDDE